MAEYTKLTKNVLGRIRISDASAAAVSITAVRDISNTANVTLKDNTYADITLPIILNDDSPYWETDEVICETAGVFGLTVKLDLNYEYLLLEVEESSSGPQSSTLQTCNLVGYIADLTGAPLENASISARLLAAPELVTDAYIQDEVLTAVTDSSGYFSLTVLIDTQLEIYIPEVNFKRSVQVPDSVGDHNLFGLSEV